MCESIRSRSRDRTQSPSTAGQLELGRLLVDELREAGTEMMRRSTRTATSPRRLPPTTSTTAPVIGLLAHMDTTTDAPGAGVEPIVHRDYDGRRHRAAPRGHPARSRDDARAAGQGRPRHRHEQRRHAPGCRRQGRCRDHHGGDRALAAHPELPRPDAADRLHPGRGDRRRGHPVRHPAVRSVLRLHARRLGDRRAPGRDVQRVRGHGHGDRDRRPSRPGDRQARQRPADRRRDHRCVCRPIG